MRHAAFLYIVLFGGLLICCRSLASSGSPQRMDSGKKGQPLKPICQLANETMDKGTIAYNLALERYQLVKPIERQFGFFPLWQAIDTDCRLLFPRGRPDRVYILLRGAQFFLPKYGNDALLCYQRKNNQDKLVYRVTLKWRPSQHNTKIKRLTTYLNSYVFMGSEVNGHDANESYTVTGRISNYVRQDLTQVRDYAQYTVIPGPNYMMVVLFSDLKGGRLPEADKIAFYGLDKDPTTNAELKPGEFYRSFGLPGGKAE